MRLLFEFLWTERNWLFPGLGLAVLSLLGRMYWKPSCKRNCMKQEAGNCARQLQAGAGTGVDQSQVAKDHAEQVQSAGSIREERVRR